MDRRHRALRYSALPKIHHVAERSIENRIAPLRVDRAAMSGPMLAASAMSPRACADFPELPLLVKANDVRANP
jgi:hypothetical protein